MVAWLGSATRKASGESGQSHSLAVHPQHGRARTAQASRRILERRWAATSMCSAFMGRAMIPRILSHFAQPSCGRRFVDVGSMAGAVRYLSQHKAAIDGLNC